MSFATLGMSLPLSFFTFLTHGNGDPYLDMTSTDTKILTVVHVGKCHTGGQASQHNRQNSAVAPGARVPNVDVVPACFLWEHTSSNPPSKPIVRSDGQCKTTAVPQHAK